MTVSAAETHKFRKSERFETQGSVSLILILLTTLLTLGLLYCAEHYTLPFSHAYCYLCLLPVFLTAFHYGLRLGLAMSVFLSAAFLPELYWAAQLSALSAETIALIAFILLLNIFAYVVADMAASLRTHRALKSAVSDWEALMTKASSLDQVSTFILKQVQHICEVETACLLLRNLLDAQWEVIVLGQEISLRSPVGAENERQNLAQWLLDQEKPLILNGLDRDPRFEFLSSSPSPGIRSLLARPLRYRDQTLMGLLLLLNRKQGEFAHSDLVVLDDLTARSEKALEQAGLYAQTDFTLTRRIKQLAAIQRTVRELNATLDPEKIIEQALYCALEITEGKAGLISLDAEGLPQLYRTRRAELEIDHPHLLAVMAWELERATILPVTESSISLLLPDSQSRLLAPIRREGKTLGLVMVERAHSRVFSEASLHLLTTLTDHTAIALENARLFREIQREKNKIGLIIHSIADGLFTTDQNGRILTLNPAVEQLTGWQAKEIIGHSSCELLGHTDSQDVHRHDCPIAQALKKQKIVRNERLVIRQRLGTQRVISLSAAPVPGPNDQLAGLVVLFRDITVRDELDRIQQEFIAAISHELRSPIANISTIVEIMMTESEDMAPEQQRRYLNTLLGQSCRLESFADSILELFQLETGHLTLQPRPLPISLLMEQSVKQWEMTIPQHTFLLQTPKAPLWMWADENGTQMALNNLIDNALKYSPPGTTITVTAEADTNEFITISVQDQGPGIAPEHQTKIFDRFYRVDGSDAQSVYGQGLGLYIARRLIEAMGGEIWVESDLGQGSQFTFILPQMEEQHE